MVRVDDVYQKVLALANKEQRGYITPQDFNLFANQAQMEIFEQYFYDINAARRTQGNDTIYADIDDMLEEKLQIFENFDDFATISTYYPNLPDYIYRVREVEHNLYKAEILNTKDFNTCINGGPLLTPNKIRPIVNIRNNIMTCVGPNNTQVTPTGIYYLKIPTKVDWTYVVINKQAMYDANASTMDFELHRSEENQLVNKILRLAGISNKQQDIMQAANALDIATITQQPKI